MSSVRCVLTGFYVVAYASIIRGRTDFESQDCYEAAWRAIQMKVSRCSSHLTKRHCLRHRWTANFRGKLDSAVFEEPNARCENVTCKSSRDYYEQMKEKRSYWLPGRERDVRMHTIDDPHRLLDCRAFLEHDLARFITRSHITFSWPSLPTMRLGVVIGSRGHTFFGRADFPRRA